MSRQSTKNKKYALRKIGKVFGSCVVATIITLGGAAIMAPNVTVYASDTIADPGENNIENFASNDDGYEVIIPKGKKYVRNDEIESHTPVLKEEGYNGRSFILPKEGEEDYFFDHPMSKLFTKLYDKDGDDTVDDEYKNPEPVDNSHAGETIDGKTVPYRSEIDPKYPHVVDSGLTGDGLNNPGVWKYNPDGKYEASDGQIDEQDTIVVARKPIRVDENADDNVVNEDGSVVLSSHYRIQVNEGENADKKDDVYEVGTKPKVVETPIDYPTRYEKDDESPKGKETEVTPGVNGKTVTTTTYEVDPNTGKVTENPSTSETTPPVTRVVKIGAQPKVEETPIPFPTRYEDDNSIPEGEEREVTAGVNGETVKTTTYAINPDTGEVTANEPTSETTNPVTRVVKRGTQPKPGETPETPQPEQPTAPEEAPAQPGQPSEPADQPNLKVAPPTIAIVEEANKASIEVKAPKKDADTVKITYPKSDGSGEEVLTLTKQPTGEWTLDKQPENVTLDKKTGTVTIPRESVVNKQKVQAQAKHKTSAYTPFVYAALSIEAANPEYPVTLWVDRAGTELKKPVDGKQPAGEIPGYKWLSSRLEEGILTHTFEKVANGTPSSPESSTSHPMTPSSSPSTSTPEKPNKAETPAVRTVWRDENGKDLKVPSVDKEEAGEVPGYEFVESHREGDNLTVHVFRTKQAQTPAPKDQTPSPAPSKVSEQKGEAVATATSEKTVDSVTSTKTSDKAELPNTGTEANATLASAGIMTLLAGLGLGFFKKKED
ncbi:G5 domain-containing protein [Streptococcus sp. 2785]|uniref:G5 domain-containing protein n=1 Tax=Streptococcus sp. 2785 TaxID=2582669 RepID=UPI0015656124|nr:G5 domain-containing protein [Streptococcus sp. 2785]